MWQNPNIRRVLLARFISRVGGEAAFFVGIWGRAAYDFSATPGKLALLMGVAGVAGVVGSAVAGVLVDRFGPRRVMLVGEILFAPAALTLILPTSMGQLAVAVGVATLLGAAEETAVASFPPYLATGPEQLARVNASVEMAATTAFVAGPAAGAVLVRVAGLDSIFVLDAITSLAALVLVAGVRVRPVAAERHHTALRELREGVARWPTAAYPPLSP